MQATALPLPPVIRRPASPRSHYLAWSLLILLPLLVGAYLLVNVLSYFRLGRDARALRNAALQVVPPGTPLRMEFAVGPGTLALARLGTAFVDLDPDARSALDVLRSAEVGVYRLESGGLRGHPATLLNQTDRAMAARGWERLAGVIHDQKVVAVYLPEDLGHRNRLRLCVLTLTEQDMVIAGATGHAQPLLDLAQRHLPATLPRPSPLP